LKDENYFRDFYGGYAGGFATKRFFARHAEIAHLCESPIERVMLGAIIFTVEFSGWYYGTCHVAHRKYEWPDPTGGEAGEIVYVQPVVGPYRPDFLIVVRFDDGSLKFAVIECDGHDYHERTKEQAAYDRERDRWMTERGIKVFRFTGSEIWRDPAKCVNSVMRAIESTSGVVFDD
jgi:very-short-patch-repair endonuclease